MLKYLVILFAVTLCPLSALSEGEPDRLALHKACVSGQSPATQYPICVSAYEAIVEATDLHETYSAPDWSSAGQSAYMAGLFRVGIEGGTTNDEKASPAVCRHMKDAWAAYENVLPSREGEKVPAVLLPSAGLKSFYDFCAQKYAYSPVSSTVGFIKRKLSICQNASLESDVRYRHCSEAYASAVDYIRARDAVSNEEWSLAARSAAYGGLTKLWMAGDEANYEAPPRDVCGFFNAAMNAYGKIAVPGGESRPARYEPNNLVKGLHASCVAAQD